MPQRGRAEQIYCFRSLISDIVTAQARPARFLSCQIYNSLITFLRYGAKYIVKGGGSVDNAREQFEEIYNRTKETIYRYITAKCFSLDDIDDIFQMTYAELYSVLCRRSEPLPDEDAFVMTLAKRKLAKYYSAVRRLRERFVSVSDVSDEDVPDDISVEDLVIDRETVADIRRLISKRPLAAQKAMFMYYRRGMSIKETAQTLGMSEASVKAHIYKTLSAIKRRCKKEETI